MADLPLTADDIIRMGSLPKRNKALEDQLQQLLEEQQALRSGRHTTGAGAVLGALGDFLNAGLTARKEKEIRAQQQANTEEEQANRARVFRDALTGENSTPGQGSPEGTPPPPGMAGSSPGRSFADALRGNPAALMLSGDPLLSKYAETQLAQQRLAAERELQLRKEAEHRREELADKASGNTEWDRRNAVTSVQELERARVLAGQAAVQRALDRKDAAATRAEERATREEQRQGDKVESDVQGLSKRMESAPGLARDISTLATAAQQPDIPGVGPIAGRLPDWMISDEGVKVRQAARGIIRNVIHESSGTAASDQEVDRIMGELGMKMGGSEDAFRLGLEGLAQKTRALLKAKEAGYRPEAVELARKRGMTLSSDIPQYSAGGSSGPTPTGRMKRDASGVVWEEMSDGSARRRE
jgi:hypothetical protein